MSLCIFLGIAGSAAGTAPLAAFEKQVGLNNADIAYTRDSLLEKWDDTHEICYRDIICVGPFDSDIDMEWGKTGARVIANDTYLLVGHDPTRHITYGPYVIPLAFDDFRVCYHGCEITNAFYAGANVNLTLIVYVFGSEYGYAYGQDAVFSPTQPGIIPTTWGCNISYYGCPP